MEDIATYVDRLDQALTAKIGRINAVELKQLKDEYKLFQSAFQGIYSVLLKKGLIHEDPYKYDLKISEVSSPPEGPFAESEKLDQMCVRLSQYESYLDFLNNYYEFSVDFLTMGRIKRLANLTKYFNFAQYSENSQFANTRCLAELTSLVKKGSDPLSSGIINESLLQLEKTSRKVFKTLKDLTFIHKERYKVEIRRLVMGELTLDRDFVITHEDDVVRRVRQKFGEVAPDRPFYPELVVEMLKEDYSSEAESLRDAVLKQLEVAEEKQRDAMTDRNFKTVLIDGTRAIIGVGFQLEDAIRKLEENQALLEAMDKSFFTKAKRVLWQMFGRKSEHVVHEVEYLDPVSSERKHEAIDVTAFCADATKRAQSLSAMVSKSSASFKRMEGSSEEIIYKFLARSIEEFQAFHRKLAALDDFYLGAITDPESKGKVRSVKIELGSLKNAIIKANQKRHEYIAQKDEMEQMKRLGIRDV
ncbi:MAG TPA: hypothetical protein VMX33_12285 [bacterium]|nr:hypothetical protein [bacterium]